MVCMNSREKFEVDRGARERQIGSAEGFVAGLYCRIRLTRSRLEK
jgi:hypothetical protein